MFTFMFRLSGLPHSVFRQKCYCKRFSIWFFCQLSLWTRHRKLTLWYIFLFVMRFIVCPWSDRLLSCHIFYSSCLDWQENTHTVPGNVTLWSYDFQSKVRLNENPKNIGLHESTISLLAAFYLNIHCLCLYPHRMLQKK